MPFLGGALGILSYDSGRRFETLPERSENELNFADMAIGIYDWALIVDHHLKKATLISYHNIDERLQWLENKHPHLLIPHLR